MVPLSIPLTLSWHRQSFFDRCCGGEPVRLTGLRLPCSRCNCPLLSWAWATLEAGPWVAGTPRRFNFFGGVSTSLSASESGRNDPAAVRCLSVQVLSAAGLGLRERGRWLSEFPAAYCPKNMCFPGMLSTAERVSLQDLQALSRVTVRFRCGRHAGEVRCLPQPTVFPQMAGSSVHEDGRFPSGLSQRLASVTVMCCKSLLTFALR